jgi:pyridoxal phosphate enzyme (YggS family)
MDIVDELDVIRQNYESIKNKISRAANLYGRDEADITLVVVTKGQTLDKVRMAIDLGIRDLGENYVEEGTEKIQAFSGKAKITWHMIGHIQSRKAVDAVRNFDYIHSIDSVKLATRLNRFAVEQGKEIPALLECNTSGEKSKFGFSIWNEDQWPAFLSSSKEITALNNIKIMGLMVMAPYLENPEGTRPFFRKASILARRLNDNIPGKLFSQLSMGMSSDYEIAIQEGATLVRIGQAILGARPLKEIK